MFTTLTVDDSADFRASMRQVLTARFAFIDVREASTAAEATRDACAIKPDLIFVDIRLPDGNGFDLTRLLASTLPDSTICIVALSDLPEYRAAARDCGARHYLAKGNSTGADVVLLVEAILAERVRALLIDDDARRRGLITDGLSARWPTMIVVEAADGRDGYEKAIALCPDLVLVGLPLLAATDPGLCAAIKAVHAASTIIAVGYHLGTDDREAALRFGADFAVAWSSGIDVEIGMIMYSERLRRRDTRSRRK